MFRKALSAFLSVLIFATHCVFAHSLEVNIWSERKKSYPLQGPAGLLLPPVAPNFLSSGFASLAPYGTVRKVLKPSSGKSKGTVLHIQDVHMNLEAQTNISKAVTALNDQNQLGLVALEGAFDFIDLS